MEKERDDNVTVENLFFENSRENDTETKETRGIFKETEKIVVVLVSVHPKRKQMVRLMKLVIVKLLSRLGFPFQQKPEVLSQ